MAAFGIQPTLTVGDSDDPVEVEADRVAGGVVAALHGVAAANLPHPPAPRAGSEPVVPEVGRTGGAVSGGLQSAISAASHGGSALTSAVRREIEPALGSDLSQVRVHSGPAVAGLATRLSARAFTIGQELFFPHGLPDTASPAGTHLLAHELAHAIAHRSVPLRPPVSIGPVARSVIRRSKASRKALSGLAEPKIRQIENFEVQKSLVDALEAAIPILTNQRKTERASLEAWWDGLDPAEQASNDNNYSQQIARVPEVNQAEMYLGSIQLNEIPPKDREREMFDYPLTYLPNAVGLTPNTEALIKMSCTEPLIVKNTIQTMISAGQIDYLRKAGFVGGEWQVIVEVHYTRDRAASPASMHKDTRGQTLFVNLNYLNKEEMAGPEYIVNPPPQHEHEQAMRDNLPPQFLKDLDNVRGALGNAKAIKTINVMPNGVVSFVDEAIHHSTPLIGHRQISATQVRLFLEKEAPFRDQYAQAMAAWTETMKKPKKPLLGKQKAAKKFGDLFQAGTERERSRWAALLELTEGGQTTILDRPALQKEPGLSEDEVDLLLSQYGPAEFNSAAISPSARKDGKGAPRAPFDSEIKDRKLVLKREMSQRALEKNLPRLAVESGEAPHVTLSSTPPRRAFFRTWVWAVRAKPAAGEFGVPRADEPVKNTTRPTNETRPGKNRSKKTKKPIKRPGDADPGRSTIPETKCGKSLSDS